MKSAITVSLVEEARGGPFVLWDGLAASCQLAGELGYDAIEIFAPGPDAVDSQELERLLADHSLQVAAVGTGAGMVKHGLSLADAEISRRIAAKDFVKAMIDFGGPFKAPAIIGSMQGRSTATVSAEDARKYLVDALQECGEHAVQYGVPLIYEPLNRYETNQVNTVAEGLRLLEEVNGGNVKLLCDLFHMQIEERDVAAAIRAGGDSIGHIHFVDSNRRPVGEGHLHFGPIVAALRDINYRGYLSAEAFPYPDPRTAAEQTLRGFRYWTGATG